MEVQEDSTNASVFLDFYGADGEAEVPDSASYKVLGKEIGDLTWTELRALTGVGALAEQVEVALDATETAMIGSGSVELRRMCVYVNASFWESLDFDLVAKPTCS